MKLYCLQTVSSDEKGVTAVILHKNIYFSRWDAFKECHKLGADTFVIELTQTDSWTPEYIKDFAPCPGC